MVNLWSGQTSPEQDHGRQRDSTEAAVAAFGRTVADKLNRGGDPEDQLRGPVEQLFNRIGRQIGVETIAYGEVSLKDIRARPDYAVDVGSVRVGYVELKAPGRGVPPQWRPSKREQIQWDKLKSLPNLIYTDGRDWARFEYGELIGEVVRLEGSLSNSRTALHPKDHRFEATIRDFLLWAPKQPRTLPDLIKIVAGLCRLLRDEVQAILLGSPDHAAREDLELLAADWRELLFPSLDDAAFSDAYAQTVTFAMLLACANGISFDNTSLHEIARQLGKKHSLIGRCFAVLTDSEATDEIRVVETLRRVIGAADWTNLGKSDVASPSGHGTNIYATLYENFLAEYDASLRRRSGSYYTPEPVARFMVDFVDQVLRSRLKISWGFASEDVVVVDPAMGTGTFLVEIVRAVADTIDTKQGPGARPSQLRELFRERLVGFECQVAPYAVAELRLQHALKIGFDTEIPASDVRFLTDALEDPRSEQGRLRTAPYKIIERSKAEANRIKREVPVVVVIGNPPHLENAKALAPWIAGRRKPGFPFSVRQAPSMDEFRVSGQGRYESDLHGLQWYFWRWATWKVFDADPASPSGVVAFITPSSYMTGKAFAGMRDYLRRTCDEGWVIDVSPEGNRSNPDTRIFEGVSRQLCIGVFARFESGNPSLRARVHHMTVSGDRAKKMRRLESVDPDSEEWKDCGDDWQAPFLPATGDNWQSYPTLDDLMPWTSRGVTAGRTWIYAPDREVLEARWRRFINADRKTRRLLFREVKERGIEATVKPLPGFSPVEETLAREMNLRVNPIRVAYRSFDRQWMIPDSRLIVRPRPPLWSVRSEHQVYVTEQNIHPISSGPGVTLSDLIPDIDHYNARSGRVLPLYRDTNGMEANMTPGLIRHLRIALDINNLDASDVLAYIACVVSHPAYTRRFVENLKNPGVRVPIAASRAVWKAAVEVGRRVVWLQTYGQRFVDPSSGRPRGVSHLIEVAGPKVLEPIPDTQDGMPDEIEYDPDVLELRIGQGVLGPVIPGVWEYEVGGVQVVRRWFDYRRKRPRHKRTLAGLDGANCVRWTRRLTDDLLDLLAVLTACVDLEPRQADILEEVMAEPIISRADLVLAGVLPVPTVATRAPQVRDVEPPSLF